MEPKKIKTMEEFASASGLSRPTVSKFFHDPDSVKPSTRARIEAALRRFNYRPNIYAVNQNRRSTKNIGIVVPYLADPFFAELARTIETQIIEAGFRPITLSSHGEGPVELGNLESLRAIKPAGVLLAPLGGLSDRRAVRAFCNDIPTVLFDSHLDEIDARFIGSNNEQSIEMIVEYLCRQGEAPAFFEMREPTNPNAYKRRTAYLRTMQHLGRAPCLLQVDGEGWDFEAIGYREGQQVLTSKSLPTNTILCSNDRLAIGLLSAAYEMGLRVGMGSDCALRIAGHDDHPFARFTSPRLTTVRQNYSAIAAMSRQALFEQMDGIAPPKPATHRLFDGELVRRASA